MGGVLAGAFGFLLAEPVMDRAVGLEAARRAAAGEHTVDTFARSTQHIGFVVATVAVGIAFGILYGVLHALLPTRPLSSPQALSQGEPSGAWGRAVRLAAGGFFALSFVPFLRYPPDPPGVGDAATIGSRSHLWTVTLVIGLVGAAFAGLVARGLLERGVRASLRQLAVVGVLAATVALTFVLPGNADEAAVPVGLVWQFRLLSLATVALLWGGLGVTFGLLGEHASARASAGSPAPTRT